MELFIGRIGWPVQLQAARGAQAGAFFHFAFPGPLVGILLAVFLSPVQADIEKQRIASDDGRKCPHCAELIKLEANACKHCGRDVPPPALAERKCSSCSGPVVSDTGRCMECGKRVAA